jgi:hypothetical protein
LVSLPVSREKVREKKTPIKVKKDCANYLSEIFHQPNQTKTLATKTTKLSLDVDEIKFIPKIFMWNEC